ncbi:MAG TPA: VOC family protein [Steroidobacteraceae bacterium]
MNANPVGWFEIYVQDMERAKRFYESVFQGKLQKLNSPGMDMWAFPMEMNGAGAAGALVKLQGVPSGGSTLVYFRCDDCATEQRRATQAGGKIHKEKFSIGEYGFISLVVDPEGNMLGLHSMK